ncbi:TerD family protein [Zymomonas mobilis]|uniref:Stress protein n=1 Tax=Zymomonas mobilis subsp. pomaceae (strain ATCC 29192 / DSM 22645 / JCM 10191 / CCUG 17912 / NBRC 13757 / NCIMB 11200 / NRRL B-4491 / Barker I) TaxID=579138 RepID=F8ET27_ZYMMT|nr:TerD family protein [Zymomonas mobilis]AEI37931.1 stress protein [Zymomonas mobilis subsp. pomaceae ATCC 29192]MDX5949300.1 TerD family protein [Zymomonas mobilis subsp. pomaceae]GEB89693.1 tellurium resistance protein TerZ [Zymomonas mobilis subsp. pomaceae]
MVSLLKGQTISLTKKDTKLRRIAFGVGWDAKKTRGFFSRLLSDNNIDLDASCLLIDNKASIIDTVWFRQLQSKDGSVIHSGDNLTGDGEGDDEIIYVDLSKLPSSVLTLIFTINSFQGDTFDKIENAYVRLLDIDKNTELARYNLTESGSHTGLIMCSLSRRSGEWQMKAIGLKSTGRTFREMMSAIASCL